MTSGPRILLIGGTYRALCVLERLLDRGERIVAFLGEEGSGEHDFCPEILEACDRAGIPARSARKLGEEVVRWLEDRIRPDLAVSVGLRGEVPLSIGGNCRLGLLEVLEVQDEHGARPAIALRHQGREVVRRELDTPKEDEPAGQFFVRLTEEMLDLLEQHLLQLGRAHARPQIRVSHESGALAAELYPCAGGPAPAEVDALERQAASRIGVARALALPGSADAARLACAALGIAAGDEVIAPALVSAGVVRGLEQSGARVVLADVEPRSLALDIASVREQLSPRTRAIVVSHAFGYRRALEPLAELARAQGIALVEDCGVAFGAARAAGRPAASAHACIFEMQEVAGEPGAAPALLGLPGELGAPLERAAPLGATAAALLAAALLAAALLGSDERAAARARNAAFYDRELWRYDAFFVRGALASCERNFACYPLGITPAARTSAEDLHRLLAELGIETRLLPALASDRVLGELPIAAHARENTLLLPVHAGLTESMCAAVLDALYDYAIG